MDKATIVNDKGLALEKMLHKETLQVTYQKICYGFYLNRIISEHERMKMINSELHYKNSMNIFEMMTNKTTEFITSLADNTAELTKIDKFKENIEENNENIEQNNESNDVDKNNNNENA